MRMELQCEGGDLNSLCGWGGNLLRAICRGKAPTPLCRGCTLAPDVRNARGTARGFQRNRGQAIRALPRSCWRRMSKNAVLQTIEKEIIALGASVGAGCQPCTAHHIEAARAAGACEKRVTLAVTAAADVRRPAAEEMKAWGIGQIGGAAELPDDWLAQRRLIRSLVSAAAAFAMNSVPEFRRCAEEAHHHGATDQQIQVAVTIARKIKGGAAEKIEAVAQQLLAEYQPEEQLVGGRCGCSA